METLNDKFDNVYDCEDFCSYSCNCLIKQNDISLCGVIELMTKNKK